MEYAYRYRDHYPNGVIWINADQDIDAQLIDVADKARWLAPESEHKHKLQIAQQRIRSYSNCLIIFDNLEDRQAIDSYLPEPEANPHILVTSRNDQQGFSPIPLKLLDEELSLELLIQESQRIPDSEDEKTAARTIAVELGGLPLALELAGGYLQHKPDVSFRRYQELLSKDLKAALPRSVSSFTKHEADLYHTLKVSEDLFQEDEQLREVLDLLTWSGSAPMTSDLIANLLRVSSEMGLVSALALGTALRLLQRSEAGESYSLHRLVGEVRRGEIPLEERKAWVDRVCYRLGDWFQEIREDFSKLPIFEAQIDHLKAWQHNASGFSEQHASRLMWLQAYPSYHRGRHSDAREYVKAAREIFVQLGETDRELEANLLNDLASTDAMLGDFGSVLEYQTHALKIRLTLFGSQHREIARSLSNMSSTYGGEGNLRLALDYAKQALAMRRALFDEPHPDIAGSLSSVGHWYGEQGDLDRALDYSKQALAMRRDLFGQRHPDIADSLAGVGVCLGRQGDLDRSLNYSKQALTMYRELLGEQHPDIANSLSRVSHSYALQRDLCNALDYSEQAMAMRRDLFGQRHPDLADSLADLGLRFGEQGDFDRALEYSEQALAMRRELFGQRHPDIAHSLNGVGFCHGEQGDPDKALYYAEQALAMRRELFGDQHPAIASSLSTVGKWYGQQGDLDKALDYSEQALEMRRDLFGQRHPDIATSLNNVGIFFNRQGDFRRAIEYMRQALEMWRTLYGDLHPHTAEAALTVIKLLITLNQRTEAYGLMLEFLKVLPSKHPAREALQSLKRPLLAKTIQKGFRQPSKKSKLRRKKKRR